MTDTNVTQLPLTERMDFLAGIRSNITDLWSQYRLRALIFKRVFSNDKDYKLLVDGLYYYGGGYPSENSPGRMEDLVRKAASFINYYRLVGESNLVIDEFAKYGIGIFENSPIPNGELSLDSIQYIREIIPDFETNHNIELENTDKADLLTTLFNDGRAFQKDICRLADIIKLDHQPRILKDFSIVKHEFDKLLGVAKRRLLTQNVDKIVNKFRMSVEVFIDTLGENDKEED